MPLIAYILMCIIFGTTYLAIKVGVDAGLPPLLFAALRFAIAGPVSLLIVLLRRLPLPTKASQYGALAGVGLFSTTLVYAILFWAEQYIPSGIAAVLLAGAPMLVIVVRRRWSQAYRAVQIAGLCAGITGVIMVVLPQVGGDWGAAPLWAAGLLLLSGLFLAIGSVRAREAMEQGVHPLTLNAFQMLFGGLGLFICSLLFEFPVNVSFTPAGFAALAHLSIVGSVVGFGIYYWLVARIGPLLSSTWTYLAPAVATAAGVLVLRESAGWPVLVGVPLVVLGAALTDPDGLRNVLKP